MGKVYYNQADSRWANHPYTAPSYHNATVKSAGCGPTCAAMVISSCKEIIYPDAMCDLSKENGYRVDGGTSDEFFTFICNKWGLEIERIHSSYDAFDKCKNGYFVVMCAGPGLWTTGGHFILAVGTRNDEIQIYDPYLYAGKFDTSSRKGANVSVEGTSCFVQIDKFKQYSNIQRLYAIKVGNIDPEPKPQPATGLIADIQRTLNNRYGFGIAVDNIAGNQTKTALIKALQTELNRQYNKGLAVDGIFGPVTKSRCITLRKGASGNITYIMQARLTCLGYTSNGQDGVFGNATLNDVKSFQKSKGIVVDGIVGQQTWGKLFN